MSYEDLTAVEHEADLDTDSGDRAVYTVKETRRLLGLSLRATYALIRSGEIPAKQLGGRWVVPKDLFHSWLNQPTAPAAPEVAVPAATASAGGNARWSR